MLTDYLLRARGRASVRETIIKALAASTPAERAKEKAVAMGKLEILKDLDLISARDAEQLGEDIKAVSLTVPVPSAPALPVTQRGQPRPEVRCLDIGTGQLLTVSEFNAMRAAGLIKPCPVQPAQAPAPTLSADSAPDLEDSRPRVNTITAAWQE